MAISRGAGGCSKYCLFIWSPDHFPIWCFFWRVLLALHSDILAMHPHWCLWYEKSPKAQMCWCTVQFRFLRRCRNRICIGSNPWVMCSFVSPPCFAMPVVWREPSSLQTPGNLGEGELAHLQCRYPCSAGVTFRTTSRKTGKNGGYISSKRQRCLYPSI